MNVLFIMESRVWWSLWCSHYMLCHKLHTVCTYRKKIKKVEAIC